MNEVPIRRCIALLLCLFIVAFASGCLQPKKHDHTQRPDQPRVEPKNVIFFLGDGMGFESVRGASVYLSDRENSLSFESLPHQASMFHNNASDGVTDSGASATALATGFKVNNGVLSVALPGDGRPLETILEHFQSRGKKTGLVTNSFIEDAGPAAFAAHRNRRRPYSDIAYDLLYGSKPHLLMGGFQPGAFDPASAVQAGYTVVKTRREMRNFPSRSSDPVAGLFGVGHLPYEFDGRNPNIPDLSEMTAKALEILETHPDGFFLFVENENIDEAGHQNHLQRHIAATVELHEAVEEALLWSADRKDTLIIVTSDHETGGLQIVRHRGQGLFPVVTWSTRGHTKAPVPIYAKGPLSENFYGEMENTDFFQILTGRAP